MERKNLSPEEIDNILSELATQNQAELEKSQVIEKEGIDKILPRIEQMEQNPPLEFPEDPTEYGIYIENYFSNHQINDEIEFTIPMGHLGDPNQQKEILTAIGNSLRQAIFRYCADLINSVPDNDRECLELPLGETILDIRHAEETLPIHSIYIYVHRQTGKILLTIINPSHFDPEKIVDDVNNHEPWHGAFLVDQATKNTKDVAIKKTTTKVIDSNAEIVGTECTVSIEKKSENK